MPNYEENPLTFNISLLAYTIRSSILAFLVIFFIWLFNFILYSKTASNDKQRELQHKKYLQYMNSFMWVGIFGLLTFANIYSQLVEELTGSINGPPAYPRIITLLQLFVISLSGIYLVFRAFDIKLEEIEKKAIEDQ